MRELFLRCRQLSIKDNIRTLSENVFVSHQVQINVISSDNVGILCLSCNVKHHKTTDKLYGKRTETSVVLIVLQIYCYNFIPSITMHQVTKKIQAWSVILYYKYYPVNNI